MRLRVIDYDFRLNCHIVVDDHGSTHLVDFFRDGPVKGIKIGEGLIGKTVDVAGLSILVETATSPKVVVG